jgi:hypothetical protein
MAAFAADLTVGLTAVLEPTFEADAVFEAIVFEPAFEAAAFEAEVFELAVLEVVVLADILAVLLGISPLLFLEDFPAEPLAAVVRVIGAAVRVRAFAAPRRGVEALEFVFLRVFCNTACARVFPTPSWMFTPEPFRTHKQVKASSNSKTRSV